MIVFPLQNIWIQAYRGYDSIYEELCSKCGANTVLVFDYYPGVDEKEVMQLIDRFDANVKIATYDILKSQHKSTSN